MLLYQLLTVSATLERVEGGLITRYSLSVSLSVCQSVCTVRAVRH